MKKLLIYLPISILFLAGCNTEKSKEEEVTTDSIAIVADSATITDSHYFWSAEMGGQGITMKRIRPASKDSLSVDLVISMLNSVYPEVRLEKSRLSNDTLFTSIPQSSYLSRQMGSSGAQAYLAEATYNLTEVTGIDFVSFSFKEGDHATPGTYSRTDFVKQ